MKINFILPALLPSPILDPLHSSPLVSGDNNTEKSGSNTVIKY